MLSRRAFVAASLASVASHVRADDSMLLDLDFCDRSAVELHRRALDGTLRYARHEVFDEPAGLLIEDAAINGVEDAGYRNDGAFPTGWTMPDASPLPKPCKATFTRVSDGQGRLQLRGESAGDYYVTLGSSRYFAVMAGDHLMGSMAIRLAAGDRTMLASVGLLILERNDAGDIANAAPVVAPVQQLQTDRPWWAQARIVVGVNGYASLVLKLSAAGPFDLSFDIHSPQLEKRGWRSSFCLGTREADAISLSDPQAYLAHQQRSLVITADTPRCVPSATLWYEGSDSGDAIEIVWRDHALYVVSFIAGVTREINLGMMPPLTRFSVCLVIATDSITASLNGKAPKQLSPGSAALFTRAQLGQGRLGRWNATIAQLTLYKARVFDPAVESLRDIVFYDDFDRADSRALGRSPSGQVIARVGAVETSIVNKTWIAVGGLGLSFAAYGKITLPEPPLYQGAVLSWTAGYAGGGAGLLAATHDLTPPTNALHTVVTDREQIFQTLTNSSVDAALASFVYPQPIARDGVTRCGVARLVSRKDNAVVFIGPQGDLARHVSPTYVASLGPTAVFEHYWQAGQCRPQFHAVAAR